MIGLGKKIITIWNRGESDSTPIIYDETEWEERLKKAQKIRLETPEETSSQEIKSALDFLSYLNEKEKGSDFFRKNEQTINASENLINFLWKKREGRIETEKKKALRLIEKSLKIVKEINLNFEIKAEEIKKLEEEIELDKIKEKKEEILRKMEEFVSQLVKENFGLVKEKMSEEECKPFETTTGNDLNLRSFQNWLMLFKKIEENYGDYLSIKKNWPASLSRMETLNEKSSWIPLEECLKNLKKQRELIELIENRKPGATKNLLTELNINQEIQRIENLLVRQLRIEIWKKINLSLKKSSVNINEEEINERLGVNDYHKLIDEKSLDDLWKEMCDNKTISIIVSFIKNIERQKQNLIKYLINKKLSGETLWKNGILFYDIKKGVEFLNCWEIAGFFSTEKIFEEFINQLKKDFDKIGKLLQKIKNINDNVLWGELQEINKEFNQCFSEKKRKRDPFIRKLFIDNESLIKYYQEKLKSEIESYIEREQDFVNQLATNWQEIEKNSDSLVAFREKLNQPWQWVKRECQNQWIEIFSNCKLYQQALTDLEKDLLEAKEVQDLSNLVKLDQLEESEKKLESWLKTNDFYKINAREHNSERIKEEKEKIHSLHETYKNLTTELAKDSKSMVELEEIKRNLEEWQNPTDNEELKKLVSQNWAETIRTKITEIDNKITEIQKIEEEKTINVLLTGKTATLSSLVIISLLISSLLWWKRKALESLLLSNRKPVVALSPWLNCRHCNEVMEIWQEKNLIGNCGGCRN